MRPLYKEIAFTGEFVDCEGREVHLTEAVFREALRGTQELMDAGFKVRAYSSHFTSDAKDIMGTWPILSDDNGSIYGIFEAIDDASRERAKSLDTSMVVEESIDIGNGRIIPIAITRVDIVGQGAIVGTERFAEMSTYQNSRKAARQFASSKSIFSIRRAIPEGANKMKLDIKRGLARALNLAVDSDVDEYMLDELIEKKLGIDEVPEEEKEAAMSAALAKALMLPDADIDIEAEAEEEPEKEEEVAEMKAQLSRQRKQIESLENDKIERLLDSAPEEKHSSIRAQFGKLRSKAGFQLAYEAVKSQVDAYGENSAIAALSHFRRGTENSQIAARRTAKPIGENLLIAAARRKGLIPSEKNN